jgi:PAS domain-containing protein
MSQDVQLSDLQAGPGSSLCGISVLAVGPSEHRVVWCNDLLRDLLGRSEDEILGSSLTAVLGTNARDNNLLGEAIASTSQGATATAQLVCHHSGGRAWRSLVSINCITDLADTFSPAAPPASSASPKPPGSGARSRLVLVLHHETAREAPHVDMQLLQHLALHICSEGITICDPNLPDTPIIYANDAFLEMTG